MANPATAIQAEAEAEAEHTESPPPRPPMRMRRARGARVQLDLMRPEPSLKAQIQRYVLQTNLNQASKELGVSRTCLAGYLAGVGRPATNVMVQLAAKQFFGLE